MRLSTALIILENRKSDLVGLINSTTVDGHYITDENRELYREDLAMVQGDIDAVKSWTGRVYPTPDYVM